MGEWVSGWEKETYHRHLGDAPVGVLLELHHVLLNHIRLGLVREGGNEAGAVHLLIEGEKMGGWVIGW